ncbi:unnamed protein product [Ilex paraguariensis]|uniref:Glycolipid transfer protein domain-containing protein n=1 Tax=Ilex paraguariensis TaxID=185542 RepID=A0ABC8ULU5_9AQUA
MSMLEELAKSFEEFAYSCNSGLKIWRLVSACDHIATFIGHFGSDFTSVQREFRSKENEKATGKWYNSRDLVRVKRSIAMLRVIFEQILKNREDSLTGPVNVAYDNILAPYHSYIANRFAHLFTMVEDLPTMEKLLEQLGETWDSAVYQMRRYVQASKYVTDHIENLFNSYGLAAVLQFEE